MPKSKIFVSHISKEAALAEVLQENIRRDFQDTLEVFVSSDGVSIEAGDDWLKSVRNALKGAKAVIVLCSKESVGRPWVNFEAGAAWLRDVPIIPVCHTDLKPDDLPLPLKLLQAVEANQPAGVKRLYARLARIVGADEPKARYAKIAEAVKDCEQEYRKARTTGATLDRIPDPKILCAASEQYAKLCEYKKDLAVIRAAFPKTVVVNRGALTAHELCEVLTTQRFDIIHLVCFVDPHTGSLRLSETDTQTLLPVGIPDEIPAEGFAKLVALSGTRLVVLASCDSLILGAKLARGTNMLAAHGVLITDEVVSWERNFYRILSKGHPISMAHDVATATNKSPLVLMINKDVAFAPEPSNAQP